MYIYLKILTEHSENANLRVPEGLWLTHADTLYRPSLAWKTGNRDEQERSAEMLPEVIQFLETHNKDSLVAEIISRIQPGLDMRYYVEHQAEWLPQLVEAQMEIRVNPTDPGEKMEVVAVPREMTADSLVHYIYNFNPNEYGIEYKQKFGMTVYSPSPGKKRKR